jgi:hypothetical protein
MLSQRHRPRTAGIGNASLKDTTLLSFQGHERFVNQYRPFNDCMQWDCNVHDSVKLYSSVRSKLA